MKNITTFLLVAITAVHLSSSQSIEFELITPQPELQGSDTGDMEFADIDNDGDADLIITGSGSMSSGQAHSALTTIYVNDGNGNLTPSGSNGIENIRVSKIGLADIDGDSDVDLLISGSTHGGVDLTRLYTNDGNGNFTEELNTAFHNLNSGYFEFGDLDGDGDEDIIFSRGNSTTDNIFKLENDGNGNFTEIINIGVDDINGVLELFDYDNDDDLDVLVAGVDSNDEISSKLFENNGSGIFSLVSETAFNNFDLGDIAIGDTDDDGDLDVLLMGNKTGTDVETEFYTNNGDGTFTWETDAPFVDVSFFGETSFNDFDNDGDLDVFLIGSGEGGLINDAIVAHIYENQGNNEFVLSDELIGGYLSTHAVADIDNDNFPDLVLGGTTTGTPVRGSFIYMNTTEDNLSVEEDSLVQTLIYPNPSNGTFYIDVTSNVIFDLYDITGKSILNDSLNFGKNSIKLTVPDGIYVISITSAQGTYNHKLVVQN